MNRTEVTTRFKIGDKLWRIASNYSDIRLNSIEVVTIEAIRVYILLKYILPQISYNFSTYEGFIKEDEIGIKRLKYSFSFYPNKKEALLHKDENTKLWNLEKGSQVKEKIARLKKEFNKELKKLEKIK